MTPEGGSQMKTRMHEILMEEPLDEHDADRPDVGREEEEHD